MQSQWATAIIKHTFKSYTDREDTGPWRGLHCVSEDKKREDLSMQGWAQVKNLINSFAPYTYDFSYR